MADIENYKIPSNLHHAINNIEFHAKNLNDLKEFYGNVFHWEFKEYGADYLEFNDGNILGGFNRNLQKSNNGPLVIIYSDNLEATEELREKFGGKISEPIASFPGGRRFQFLDVEDNELAVWSDK